MITVVTLVQSNTAAMASCSNIPHVEMRSSALQNREQIPARKSSFFKSGVRRISSVTFGENNMIEIEKREEAQEQEDKENADKLSQIKEDKHCDGEGKVLL